ncbi:hypothetical protein EVAR_39269_1 [Eumeta japonica]|uniref:Uncharacterized protein n=1 Tax=Eumeta variegata TaxID=151549 RepID=A0A4C1VXZ3_EUMVA|nr:hypothetical protein EVAR_39269_1 [Eumeta japonica]
MSPVCRQPNISCAIGVRVKGDDGVSDRRRVSGIGIGITISGLGRRLRRFGPFPLRARSPAVRVPNVVSGINLYVASGRLIAPLLKLSMTLRLRFDLWARSPPTDGHYNSS